MKKFIVFCLLFDLFTRVNAQSYTIGVPVSDTIPSFTSYGADCPNDLLKFRLDSTLIPYVTGLNFQVEITSINGLVLVDNTDTVYVGDIFPLPYTSDSNILTINLPDQDSSFFNYLVEIVGTPTVEGESYYCDVETAQTLMSCNNYLEIYSGSDSTCKVQPPLSSTDSDIGIPNSYILSQNFPNPFNPNTRIDYYIPHRTFVTIKIYNILGKEVRVLVNHFQNAGNHSIDTNANDLLSGIYFYQMSVNNELVDTKKMILIR